jgi:hypothetical protein
MKAIAIAAAVLTTAMAAPAPGDARGCLKGAVVGGAAGHFMHHHGLIGAGVGCAIGHHEAAMQARNSANGANR